MKKKIIIYAAAFSIILFTTSLFSEIIYVPVKLANAKKGDVVLEGNSTGMIGTVLSSAFGGFWAHSGMVIDDGYTVRHTTMEVDELKLINNWMGVPKMVDPFDLENGPPGTINESIDAAFKGQVWWIVDKNTDAILSPADADELEYRPYLEKIADTFDSQSHYYRIHHYINKSKDEFMSYFNPLDYLVPGKGTHCSGSIFYAHYVNGIEMNLFYAPPEIVNNGAYALYDSLYLSIRNIVKKIAGPFAILLVNEDAVAERIANQVVNAFGLDVYDDTSDTWRSYEGKVDTIAISPDHLLRQGLMNPDGNSTGVQTAETTYYGKIENNVYSGGYFIDTPDGDDIIVELYSSTGYKNKLVNYTDTGSFNLSGNLNDRAASIIVDSGHEVWLYQHADFKGRRVLLKRSSKDLYQKFNLNKKVSSIKIQKKIGHGTPVVHCYNKANFHAEDGNVTSLTVGRYKRRDMRSLGQKSNTLSSLKIDHGLKVTLYDGPHFNAGSVTFRGDVPFLSYNNFDNKTASIVVEYDDF